LAFVPGNLPCEIAKLKWVKYCGRLNNMTKPIKPSEVAALKQTVIPDFVFKTFNELIAKNFVNNSATVKQDDVIDILLQYCGDAGERPAFRQEIFKEGWLNVEESFREVGWNVEYDKPAYNETYPATFTFSIKK
jgi:hypothetical protein